MKKIQVLLLTLLTPFRTQASLTDFFAQVDGIHSDHPEQCALIKSTVINCINTSIQSVSFGQNLYKDSAFKEFLIQLFDPTGQKNLRVYLDQIVNCKGKVTQLSLTRRLLNEMMAFKQGRASGFASRIDWQSRFDEEWIKEWLNNPKVETFKEEFSRIKSKIEGDQKRIQEEQGHQALKTILSFGARHADLQHWVETVHALSFRKKVAEDQMKSSGGKQLERILYGAIQGMKNEENPLEERNDVFLQNNPKASVQAYVILDEFLQDKLIPDLLHQTQFLDHHEVIPQMIASLKTKIDKEKEYLKPILHERIQNPEGKKAEEEPAKKAVGHSCWRSDDPQN